MFLHLGQSVTVLQRDVIGIFDLDNTSASARTRRMLARAQQDGRVINAAEDLPKSFVLCQSDQGPPTVYLSQLSTATLRGRAEAARFEWDGSLS